MTGYKLFRVKKKQPGLLFPLYVLTDHPVRLGVWMDAEEGPRTESGRVQSRFGPLCFRPGWHLSDLPFAGHIGIKENGRIRYMHDDEVWCECEYSDAVDYQPEADANGMRNGKFSAMRAMLKHIPWNGYYRFRTNPVMFGRWIIAGSMKVSRVLTDKEVESICSAAGCRSLPRRIPMDLTQYDF